VSGLLPPLARRYVVEVSGHSVGISQRVRDFAKQAANPLSPALHVVGACDRFDKLASTASIIHNVAPRLD